MACTTTGVRSAAWGEPAARVLSRPAGVPRRASSAQRPSASAGGARSTRKRQPPVSAQRVGSIGGQAGGRAGGRYPVSGVRDGEWMGDRPRASTSCSASRQDPESKAAVRRHATASTTCNNEYDMQRTACNVQQTACNEGRAADNRPGRPILKIDCLSTSRRKPQLRPAEVPTKLQSEWRLPTLGWAF